VIVVYWDKPVACSCFKKYDANTIEIKTYVCCPDARGKGLAQIMLLELEAWATQGFFGISLRNVIQAGS
jgi:GNAT superfamily N-acetyltransferase